MPKSDATAQPNSDTNDLSATTCFVIAPIGAPGTPTRVRSDQVLRHIITPVAFEFGLATVRADTISESGVITTQILQHVLNDALVIADLTERNPNVFYELAARHATGKPTIQIIDEKEEIRWCPIACGE